MDRSYFSNILSDLNKKMVFLSGPRQVGKTWLAKEVAKRFNSPLYLNYDSYEDREVITQKQWSKNTDLLILDEIHKMPNWKIFLKGIYDTEESLKILVTGSARLEAFADAGESLAGRYFKYRLLPLSMGEMKRDDQETLEKLLQRGGFPEAYLSEDENDVNRWRLLYSEGLIREDILDFEKIHDFKAIKLLFELLRSRVGSPLSYQSLAEDIGISANTVKKYINIFESLFIIFRVTPFSKNIARSLLKEPKIYFCDTGLVKSDEGAKFENLIALSLYKHQLWIEDTQGIPAKLNYLRTKEQKEVDFCLVQHDEITVIIEAKNSSTDISETLKYFHKKYNFPAIQLVKNLRIERNINGISLLKASNFLARLESTQPLLEA